MVARKQSKCLLEGFFSISVILFDQVVSGFSEKIKHFLVNFGELFGCLFEGGLDEVVRLGYANLLELNSSLILDLLDLHLVFVRVESDASA